MLNLLGDVPSVPYLVDGDLDAGSDLADPEELLRIRKAEEDQAAVVLAHARIEDADHREPPDPRDDAHRGGAPDGRNRLQRVTRFYPQLGRQPIADDDSGKLQRAPVHDHRRALLKGAQAALLQV